MKTTFKVGDKVEWVGPRGMRPGVTVGTKLVITTDLGEGLQLRWEVGFIDSKGSRLWPYATFTADGRDLKNAV